MVVNTSVDEAGVFAWDELGTCRAVNKHGASTVVSGGYGFPRQSERAQ